MQHLPVLPRHPAAGYYMESPKRFYPNRSGLVLPRCEQGDPGIRSVGTMSKLAPHSLETLKP